MPIGPDERAIRALHSTWIEAVNAGDLAGLLYRKQPDGRWLLAGDAHTSSPIQKLDP